MGPICSLCEVVEESELHILRDCVIARLIWDESGLGSEVRGEFRSFADLAIVFLDSMPRKKHGLFMTICWEIWVAMNRWLFEGEACDPAKSMAYVRNLFEFVSWSFVRRDGNKVSHELAHCLPWVIGRKIWVDNFPQCIVPHLENDLSINTN